VCAGLEASDFVPLKRLEDEGRRIAWLTLDVEAVRELIQKEL